MYLFICSCFLFKSLKLGLLQGATISSFFKTLCHKMAILYLLQRMIIVVCFHVCFKLCDFLFLLHRHVKKISYDYDGI